MSEPSFKSDRASSDLGPETAGFRVLRLEETFRRLKTPGDDAIRAQAALFILHDRLRERLIELDSEPADPNLKDEVSAQAGREAIGLEREAISDLVAYIEKEGEAASAGNESGL